jgi:hypothetical protein
MDMWEDTSEGYSCSNEGIEFFVPADGKLEVARGNALDFEILSSVLLTQT